MSGKMRLPVVVAVASSAALLLPATQGLENGLSRTPIMGWSTWNAFECKLSYPIHRWSPRLFSEETLYVIEYMEMLLNVSYLILSYPLVVTTAL